MEYAKLTWTTEDVKSLFNLTDDEADAFLSRIQRSLRDRLTELGWEVIGTLGDMEGLERVSRD